MSSSVVPSEEDLKAALKALKTDNPTLGISKLQALLLESYKDWTVSEKRVRKGELSPNHHPTLLTHPFKYSKMRV